MAFLLGIDSGTSSVKVSLFDHEKGMIAGASVPCPPDYGNGHVEIDMSRYWQACKDCIREIASQKPDELKKVRAVSVSSQAVTFVCVDEHGNTPEKAIVAYDERAIVEAREILSEFGEQKIFEITGQPVISETYPASKILWLRKHDPERFANIHKLLFVHDYLIYKLTGKYVCAPSILSSSLLLDVSKRIWWNEMLDFLAISPNQLPDITDAGELVGNITREVSIETGLPPDTAVAAGAIDQFCGMIGAGNIKPGILSECTGSFLVVHTMTPGFFPNQSAGFHNFCSFEKEGFVPIGICPTAGAAFDWIKKTFFENDPALKGFPESDIFGKIIEKASAVNPGADGLIMLPHLAGKGSPSPNPQVKGMFYGFGLGHTRDHFVRAFMESVAFMLKSNIEVLWENGINITEIHSFGGGSKSVIWNHIKADVCGLEVITAGCPEPGCLGAAILAGTGCGVFKTVSEGCGKLVKNGEIFTPDKNNEEKYINPYNNYRKLNKLIDSFYYADDK